MKRDYLPHELGETTVDAMRKVCFSPRFPPHAFPLPSAPPSPGVSPTRPGGDTGTNKTQIKQAFDPLCLLNCDKVVRMQKPKKGEVAEW